ncbi:MAG: TonB-dependent receptor [Litorimonas sp.]
MFQSKYKNRVLLASSASLLTLASGIASQAQIPDDEIIITATKRATSIQDTPLAITALSGEFVSQVNLNDVKDLITYAPGVTGNSQDSFIDTVAIRGIRTQDFGVGGDPSVGFFKNGLYQGRNGSVVSTLYDVERGEVLRGPQNFLFGRNAIAGAISTQTKRPIFQENLSGFGDIEYGSRDRFDARGAINVPVSDKVAARFAGFYSREDGFVENIFDGEDLGGFDKFGFRGSIDYKGNGPLSIELTAEYEDREQEGSIYRATGLDESFAVLEELFGEIEIPDDPREVNVDLSEDSFDVAEVFDIGLKIDYDLGFATLTSQTGFKDHTFNYREDFDGTPLSINNFGLDQSGDYFEQEVRLVSQGDGPLSWYVGGSYYEENLDALFTAQGDEELLCSYYYNLYYYENIFGTCLNDAYYGATAVAEGLLEQGEVRGDYHGYAGYVDVSYAFSEKLDVSAGLRYSNDVKRFSNNILPVTSALGPFFTYSVTSDGPVEDRESWDAFTPRFLIRYRPDENNTFFASATRGFKAGGFGTFGFSPAEGAAPIEFGQVLTQETGVPDDFDPETLWSYEVGYKGEFLGGALKADINAYYYDYSDLQLLVFQDGGGLIFNLGEVNGYGAEGQLTARFSENFDGFVSLGYNENEIFDAGEACGIDSCDGNDLGSPKWSGAAVFNAHTDMFGGEVFGSAEVFFESTKGGGIENLAASEVDAFADVTLRAGYRADDWSIIGYVENVGDEVYFDQGNNNGGIIPAHLFGPSKPRTFGIRFSKSFNE